VCVGCWDWDRRLGEGSETRRLALHCIVLLAKLARAFYIFTTAALSIANLFPTAPNEPHLCQCFEVDERTSKFLRTHPDRQASTPSPFIYTDGNIAIAHYIIATITDHPTRALARPTTLPHRGLLLFNFITYFRLHTVLCILSIKQHKILISSI
jgi:hypothetical protein